jgi:hypothetical protein
VHGCRKDSRAVEAAIGEICLQRLDEATLVLGFEITLDRGVPGGRSQSCERRFAPALEVEN